jgi:hypothetical protein
MNKNIKNICIAMESKGVLTTRGIVEKMTMYIMTTET